MSATVICCCKEAHRNCYLLCAKGRKIKPDKVYRLEQWPKRRSDE